MKKTTTTKIKLRKVENIISVIGLLAIFSISSNVIDQSYWWVVFIGFSAIMVVMYLQYKRINESSYFLKRKGGAMIGGMLVVLVLLIVEYTNLI